MKVWSIISLYTDREENDDSTVELMISLTIVDEIENYRKKLLTKYYLSHLLFAVSFVLILGICFWPYGIYVYEKILIGFPEEILQNVGSCSLLALIAIGIYYILLWIIRKQFSLKFTLYVKKTIITNTKEYQGMFRVDDYFLSTNWFYKVYRNIFPTANRIETLNCFLIDYKGKKIKMGQVKIGQKIGIGKYSRYYSIFEGYFVQVPAEIAEHHSPYRSILYQDHYIFVFDKYSPGIYPISMKFCIFEKVDFKSLEEFYNALMEVLIIVSNTVKQ
ncbi:MAG: hypothetical protein RMJ51_03720 [Candidatus Calescibacterium sp.]|nr:hypothetical protein [Candidatus Calescibacterium sp.]MDW8195333.1 hypothetical protein [Candidatus Calescibacterium sp.]